MNPTELFWDFFGFGLMIFLIFWGLSVFMGPKTK